MIEIRKELEDLIKIYTDAEAHLKKSEESALYNVRTQTTTYLGVFNERENMSKKIRSVQWKLDKLDLMSDLSNSDCGCGEDDE